MPASEPANPNSQAVFDVLAGPAPPNPAKVHSALEAIHNMVGSTIVASLAAQRAELAAKVDALGWMLGAILALLAVLAALGFFNLTKEPPAAPPVVVVPQAAAPPTPGGARIALVERD